MAYEDVISLNNIDYTMEYNGELINSEGVNQENFSESINNGIPLESNDATNNKEFSSYMSFMETENNRLNNYM